MSARWRVGLTLLVLACVVPVGAAKPPPAAELKIEEEHRWTPPFGLDQVGQPLSVIARVRSLERTTGTFEMAAILHGREQERREVHLSWREPGPDDSPAIYEGVGRAQFTSLPDEVVLHLRSGDEPAVELARLKPQYPPLEAHAVAEPREPEHPIDLGLIFAPESWLVLPRRARSQVSVAIISYGREFPDARLRAWFESSPRRIHEHRMHLSDRVKERRVLELPAPRGGSKTRDTLHVTLADAQKRTFWHTEIPVMRVPRPPQLPRFGATALHLRYDLPILINHSETGQLDLNKIETLDYAEGWNSRLEDVVVSLPNGSRFVFWRGSSYIPFWAGPHNTGLCYEWAETGPPPDGFVDSVEPLMDKELRYARVEIVESTAARVHVRWTYQSTDFNYKVWGDQAVEDFYFYPDGYGTRVLSLKKRPEAKYELSEFIVLSAPGMYPLEFLPQDAVEMIYLADGQRHGFSFPHADAKPGTLGHLFEPSRDGQVVYRIRSHRRDRATGIYFHPAGDHFPMLQFGPFFDGDTMVTPAYWGSHWPLARGKSTGAKIDELVERTPSHTSLLSWAQSAKPDPDTASRIVTLDTLGRSREMIVEHYAWLIAMTDEPDEIVLNRARSFAQPPSLELEGAEVLWDGYARSRRAMRIRALAPRITIRIKPSPVTVNPVFELVDAPQRLHAVKLGGSPLPEDRYAWDGRTLWLDATISEPQAVELEFR